MGQAGADDNIQPLLDAVRQNETSATIEAQAKLYLLFYDRILYSLDMPALLEGYSREDLVQEAFFESIAALRAEKLREDTSFPSYWRQTAHNRINYLRRQNRQRGNIRDKLSRILYGNVASDGERQLIDRELIDRVNQMLDNLGEQCRKILRLYANDYSATKIALKTGYSSSATIHVTKSRCLNKLRKIVTAQNLNDPRYE